MLLGRSVVGKRIYAIAAWTGIGLAAAACLFLAFRGHWHGSGVMALFVAASVLVVTLTDELPHLFDLLLVIAALMNGAGFVWDLFDTVLIYDEFAHAYTTFAVTVSLGYLLYRSMEADFERHAFLFAVATTSFGVSLGAWWEVAEHLTGLLGSITDTISDLVFDTIGAAAAGAVCAYHARWHAGKATEAETPPVADHRVPATVIRRSSRSRANGARPRAWP